MFLFINRKFPRTYINILHDPRVVKGNTYAAFVIPSSLQLEFLRLKEEEERRVKLMAKPTKLPRVAFLSKHKTKKVKRAGDEDNKQIEVEYNEIEEEEQEDEPYFYVDKPPTPVYVPPSPGKEKGTQILDHELFDFELEVEPILQVLVGRTLTTSVYELIEEEERREFLEQTKKIEQKREFELINLQKEEAARIRRNKEIERRNIQKEERIKRDKITQKKIQSKFFSKFFLRKLKDHTLEDLTQNGVFNKHKAISLTNFVENKFLPQCKAFSAYLDVFPQLYKKFDSTNSIKEKSIHKILMDQVFKANKEEKERKEKEEIDRKIEEERKLKEKNEMKEERRIAKFTKVIEETIIKTKYDKVDVSSIPLADIDELTTTSGAIHTIGGQYGEFLIILQALHEKLVNTYDNNSNDLTSSFILNVFRNYLLGMKDTEFFNIKFLESQRFDFSAIPEEEDKKMEFKKFILDEKRFYNKSVKMLINNGLLSKEIHDNLISYIADIYFYQPVDINNPDIQAQINPDPDNQEPEYVNSYKAKAEEISKQNQLFEKLKRKIKFSFVKPEVLKKKKNNIIGLIKVNPILDTYENYTEQLVEEIIEQPKKEEPQNLNENQEPEAKENEGNEDKEIKEEEPKPEEEKPKEEAEKEKIEGNLYHIYY